MQANARGLWAAIAIASIVFVGVVTAPPVAEAKVFAGRKDALSEAFPTALRIDEKTHVLNDELAARCEQHARARLESRLVTMYTAWGQEGVLGYAHISIHNVRTKPEALLIVLTPAGEVRSVRILAFHEPLDYLPAGRWYEQFAGTTQSAPLRVGRDIHGVVGSTLSARAASEAVRHALAFYDLLVRPASVQPGRIGSTEPSSEAPSERSG
ncbi:MAG: FMN-binding protein [Actinomycetota bacterium]|nr:FMN-binding protein [Actinomycetota bacterium]